MDFPADLRYTREHEWVRADADLVTVGITAYATEQLGDIVFVELPQVGSRLEAMRPCGTIEAVKTAVDLYAPVSGEVVEVNTALADEAERVGASPYGDGWMLRVRPSDAAEVDRLMDSAAYAAFVEEQHA